MTKTIKEIIIMLLVCLITMLVLAIALYQYSPNKKIVPEITTYVATDEVQDLLEDTIDTKEDDKVLLTYEVTSGDLKNYQSTSSYVPGKTNPFAPATTTTSEESPSNGSDTENTTIPTESNSTQTSNQNTETGVSSYFKDTGTK